MTFSKVAILGPGLLGGSIALALRERLPAVRVAIWARRAESIDEIRARRIEAIASTDLAEVVPGSDLVVLCVPVGVMGSLAECIAPLLSPHTLVTDVGSVKESVVREVNDALAGRAQFIGSHPMAGSEKTGMAAAHADLFQGAVCIVTPSGADPGDAEARVSAFWQLLGCSVRTLSPPEHDEVVALVSHLPHLLAAALVDFVAGRHAEALGFCGNGFRDTTRVASGAPEMWTEILMTNAVQVKRAAEAMIAKLREIEKLLDQSDQAAMTKFLAQAKVERDRLTGSK